MSINLIITSITVLIAQGMENALEGFFILLTGAIIVVGILLLIAHYKTKKYKLVTTLLLLVYATPPLFLVISNAFMSHSDSYSVWDSDIRFIFPMTICGSVAVIVALRYLLGRK